MKTILYKNGSPVGLWHSVEDCKKSLGDSADVREVPDDHADVVSIVNAQKAKNDLENSKSKQIKSLISLLEAGAASMNQVQKALAYIIKRKL